MSTPDQIIDNLLKTYTEKNLINHSPTLISMKTCKDNKQKLNLSLIGRINDTTIFENYLKSCIEQEIKLNKKDYYVFYTSQSFGKYLSSRVLDHIINKLAEVPEYKFYIGLEQRNPTDYNKGGKYPNMKEYMIFVNNFFKNYVDNLDSKSEDETIIGLKNMLLDAYNSTASEKKTYEDLNPTFIKKNIDLVSGFLEPSYIDILKGEKKFIPSESFDAQGTEFSKNMYSLSLTALSNCYGTQSFGESTVNFLLRKITTTFDPTHTMKYLIKDIKNIVKIDDTKLNELVDKFSIKIKEFYNSFISATDSKYQTKNGIVFQLAIKKNEIYKYVLPSTGYGIPMIGIFEQTDYETSFKSNIIDFFQTISKHPLEISNVKESINRLLDKNHNIFKNYIKSELQNDCDYLTVPQARGVITDEWLKNLISNNDDIKINVFPCNYNDTKYECIDFVANLDNIILDFVNQIKINAIVVNKSKITELSTQIDKYFTDQLSEDQELYTKERALSIVKMVNDNIISEKIKEINEIPVVDSSVYLKKYLKYKKKYLKLKK